jgi:hypothetical protein
MGKMLAECPELPWEMRLELAHQMWDEARHIEIVAKACEDELGATLGYGPWPLIWWWMQNETDPLRRIAVTNSWSEANLMHMLRMWRINAEKRGYTRIAELCDYLQAAEAGKHIFVEKPICYTLDEGRAMINAVEQHGVTLMVGYMKRYGPGYEYAQRIFGQMAGVRLIRRSDRPRAVGAAGHLQPASRRRPGARSARRVAGSHPCATRAGPGKQRSCADSSLRDDAGPLVA